MPQTLTALLAAATLLAAGQAGASCRLDENDVVMSRDKRCSAEIIKATCDGDRVDIRDTKRACCALPESRKVEWRCGGAKEPSVKCPKGATSMLITPSDKGARFRCLSVLAETSTLDTEVATTTAPADDE